MSIIEELWNDVPDQRFYQMLSNRGFLEGNTQFWHVEDDELEKALIKVRGKIKNAK